MSVTVRGQVRSESRRRPVRGAVDNRVVAIILAAGASSRLGRPKQILRLRGAPLVRLAAETALASTAERVIVVTGAHQSAVCAALAGLPVCVAYNRQWPEGIASSIRRGVREAARGGFDAAVLLGCDQPALGQDHVNRLVAAMLGGAEMCASRYAGTLGIPAGFARRIFARLLALRGDDGAKVLLRAAARVEPIDWPDGAFDVDTPDDAERLATESRRLPACTRLVRPRCER